MDREIIKQGRLNSDISNSEVPRKPVDDILRLPKISRFRDDSAITDKPKSALDGVDRGRIEQALLHGDSSNAGSGMNALFAEARNPIKWSEISQHPFYQNKIQWALDVAEEYINSPIKALRFSDYRRFDTDGSRKEYEKEYFERRKRLHILAVLTLVFNDRRYIPQLEDAIWAVCDEYTWCLPAHLGGKSLSPDAIDEHRRIVDLFSAETGFALAEICSLLEEQLSPIIVLRARKLVKERVLAPYCSGTFFWERVQNNWAAVCAGSVGAAALYLIEDSRELAPILARLLNTLKSFLDGFADDGACTEGLGYWNYGFGFFVYFAELLKQRTAGDIDLLNDDKIREIALFQQKCYLSGNKVVSFSDSRPEMDFNPGLTHHLKERFGEVEIPDISLSRAMQGDTVTRWAHSIRYFIWSNPNLNAGLQQNAAYYLKDAQWLITRAKTEDLSIAFAAKGGHNDEPHNHNDVGTFILHVNGESLIADTGMGEYTKQYFGPVRYTIFCNGSQGHSLPIVNGCCQSAGRDYAAKVIDSDPFAGRFELDIAGAYADQTLKSLVRSFKFVKGRYQYLSLTDTYHFSEKPKSVIERFISFREPILSEPGKVKLVGESGSVELCYNSAQLKLSIEKNVFINHTAEAVPVYCIDLSVISPEEQFSVGLAFYIQKDGVANQSL